MGSIIDDALTFGILAFLVLWVLSKIRKESMKETIIWLKEKLIPVEENE